ncbi:MAG: hypothetical protein RIT28_3384 [Pseudomonadota bacterium]
MRRSRARALLVLAPLGILGAVDHLRVFSALTCGNLALAELCVEIKSVSTLARISRWGLTPWARREATWLLGRSSEAAAEDVLRARILETSDPTVWGVAVEAFDGADKEALAVSRPELVVGAFQSGSAEARHTAAVAARALADPSNAPWCGVILDDVAPKVRHQAVLCLARLGPGRFLDDLQRLAARETHKAVLMALVDLAAPLDDPKAEALRTQAEARLAARTPAAPAADAPPPGQ